MIEGVNPHSCSKFLEKVNIDKKISIVGITCSIEMLHGISLFYEEFTPFNQ